MKNEKILVTGAGGYVGHTLVKHLQANGYEVTGTYRREPVNFDFSGVQLDLSKPFEIDNDFDVIIHAAGELPRRKSEKWKYDRQDFSSFKHNNVDAMENIVNFAKVHSVKKIIYLSTIGIYGEISDEIINEDSDRTNPDAYGITKYLAEAILKECTEVQGISLRMPGIIGAGASGVWLTNVIEKLERGEDITIYTPDFQTKNFVWLDDLSAFIENLIKQREWKYDTLILGCKESASIKQIVEQSKDLTKSISDIYIDNSLRRPFCIDASRAYEMGYKSIAPLEIVKRFIQQK